MMALYIMGMMVMFQADLLPWHTCPRKALVIFIALTLAIERLLRKSDASFVHISHANYKNHLFRQWFLFLRQTNAYSGWYEPNSPRMELFFFLERLIGMSYIHFEDNKLLVNSLSEKNATFLPVTDTQFRYVPMNESQDPVPTLKLLTPNAEGQFIQINWGLRNASLHVTLKRIPTWLAIFEIITAGFVLLAFISILVYAPFWIFQGLSKKHRHPSRT